MQRRTAIGFLVTLFLLSGYACPAPIDSKTEGGVLTVSAGDVQVTYDAAKGLVTLRSGNLTVAGKGTLLKLSADQKGKATAANLAEPVKANKAVPLGILDQLAASVPLYEKLPCRAVALVNPGGQPRLVGAPLGSVGVPEAAIFAGFDLTSNTFLGPIRGTLWQNVARRRLILVALGQASDRPVLLCTSRTLDEGPDDVAGLEWNPKTSVLSGQSSVLGGKPYELRIFAPPQPSRWVAKAASVPDADTKAGVTTDVMQTFHWLRVAIKSPKDRKVSWQVKFAKQPAKKVEKPNASLTAKALSARQVRITCHSNVDAVVRRDGGAELVFKGHLFDDRTPTPGATHTYTIHPVSWTGKTEALATAKVEVPALPPRPPLPDVYLSDLPPTKATNGWNGEPRKDTSIEDNPIMIRGEIFPRGMGVHAKSELVYPLVPQFERFVAIVGVDDEKNSGSVTFDVYADQKQLYKSGKVTRSGEAKCIDVEIPKGAKQLRLVVGDAGDGIGCDHADWASAGFVTGGAKFTLPPPPPEPPPAGFEPIFNGKDLKGWDGDPRFWSVKDGALRGETTAKKPTKQNTFLVWRGGKVRDFVLRLKFRLRDGNSGVQYRGAEPSKWRVTGYQADIMASPGAVGMLYDEARRGVLVNVGELVAVDEKGVKKVIGSVADKAALAKAGYYKAKGWNEFAITARGNHITQTLNGYQTIGLIDSDAKNSSREGVLALQLHAGPPMLIEFKDVWLKRLPSKFAKAMLLFNGKDLTGWTFSSDKLKDTWSAKNGVLVNKGRPAGYVRTTADYTNYALRLQLRHMTKGNSGVLVRMVGQDKVWPRSIEAQGMFRNMGDIFNIDKFPMNAGKRTRGRHTPKLHPANEGGLGEWKVYEISLDGGNLEIAVNGLVQNTATECWETPGKICLQSEGAQVEFRNIVLVPIDRPKQGKPAGAAKQGK